MRLFSRKSSDSTPNAPAEVNDYYQAENRDRRGMAWLLAAGTFVVTLLLVLGVFFAGRWAYRKATNKNPGSSTEVAKPQNEGNKTDNDTNTATNNGQNTGSGSGSSRNGIDGDENSAPQTSSTSTSTPSRAVAPASTSRLPSTGPDQDL